MELGKAAAAAAADGAPCRNEKAGICSGNTGRGTAGPNSREPAGVCRGESPALGGGDFGEFAPDVKMGDAFLPAL